MKTDTKRYNLVLPKDTYNRLQAMATQKQTTMLDLIRRFIRLGMIAAELEGKPNTALVIREGDKEREIFLI